MTEPAETERIVLVADDVEGIRRLTEAVLSADGITVLQAANGEETIEIASNRQPHLILLDLAMPGLDGPETLRRLRAAAETEHIPVVIVTALAHSDLAQQALALGANDLMEKPFSPSELRSVVDKWAAANSSDR